MDGLTKPEPPLSRACCVSPDLYRPIGKFQVVGRIWKPEFNVPIIAGHGPSHPLTSTDQGCCHQPQAIPVRGLVSSAEATRTRALTTGRPRHMCRESDALPTELRDGLRSKVLPTHLLHTTLVGFMLKYQSWGAGLCPGSPLLPPPVNYSV